MRNHTVEIGDRSGHSFKVHISTPSNWGKVKAGLAGEEFKDWNRGITGGGGGSVTKGRLYTGNWRTIDKGAIRYNSGIVLRSRNMKDHTSLEIYLVNVDDTWGMKLFDYEDVFGVNDDGQGFVIQPWVLGFNEGRFSWSLVD